MLERIVRERIIAIFRRMDKSELLSVANVLVEEQIRIMEVALSAPDDVAQISHLKEELVDADVLIGAGTVVTVDLAESAIAAGADFLVTPHFTPDVIQFAQQRGVPVVPGAFTPTEVYQAMSMGAELIKVFPAVAGGPEHIAALLGPYPQARLVPTGGISADNAAAYFAAGAVAVGVGGRLVKAGDLTQVRKQARALVRVATATR